MSTSTLPAVSEPATINPHDDSTWKKLRSTAVLVGITTNVDGHDLPHTVALCATHARTRFAAAGWTSPVDTIAMLPMAVEDEERVCADCVRDAGYTYHVLLSYFKESGRYYGSGSYLTSAKHCFQVAQEVHDLILRGENPGLQHDAVTRNNFRVLYTVCGHPQAVPGMV